MELETKTFGFRPKKPKATPTRPKPRCLRHARRSSLSSAPKNVNLGFDLFVTVANGTTQLTSAQIVQYGPAPFILEKLPQLPYWVQQGTFAQVVDTGTANQIIVAPTPVPSVPPANLFVKKVNLANSGRDDD